MTKGLTLWQWIDSHGYEHLVHHHETGSKAVHVDQLDKPRIELYSLVDYAVSSACGSVVWLVPKRLGHASSTNQLWESLEATK